MTDAEIIAKLQAASAAYHDALDTAFAMLINASAGRPLAEIFYPSKSPMWSAMVSGEMTRIEVEEELRRRSKA